MEKNEKVDILAIAAHPDDVELACSGTLIQHIQNGKRVAIVDLTQGELGSRGTAQTRFEEAKIASKIMGIHYRENLKMKDGFFEITEENLKLIIAQIRRFQPEVVLCNAIDDRHPDHGRGSALASRACFLSGLLKIETVWEGMEQEKWRPNAVYHYIQDRYIQPDFVVDVTDVVDQKLDAILAYKTQFYDGKNEGPQTPISGKDFLNYLKGRWSDTGRLIGAEYGEGFTSERPMGVEDITKDIF